MLAPLVLVVFLGYLSIGLPLAALALQVHDILGFGPATVGTMIGLQSLAAVATRSAAAAVVDRSGPKRSVLLGLPAAAAGGLLYAASSAMAQAGAALAVLVVGRILVGIGESLLLTGTMVWAIGRTGPDRTSLVMSWQGIAMYGALAVGPSAGLATFETGGFAALGFVAALAPLLGLLLAAFQSGAAARPGPSPMLSFLAVLRLIWRVGAVLALATVPFAMLASFAVLLFQSEGWPGAGLALSAFGAGFVLLRAFGAELPVRFGASRVAAASIGVETLGQALIALAPTSAVALAGAGLTGIGSSLVFPALGSIALARVPPERRGAAVGGFTAFFDVTVALSAPAVGVLIAPFGYRVAFAAGAASCLAAGLALTAPRDGL